MWCGLNKVGKMLLESSVFFFFLQEAIKSKVGTEEDATLQSLVCSAVSALLIPADLDNECQAHHD